jgi:hypothetical protein
MDLLGSANSAIQSIESTASEAWTGTPSAYDIAQMNAAQSAAMAQAGGTPQQQAASVAEIDNYITTNYPSDSPVAQLQSYLPSLPDFSGIGSTYLLAALVIGGALVAKALLDK